MPPLQDDEERYGNDRGNQDYFLIFSSDLQRED